MKKYILPLILILLLSFTLIGNCAWLSGWDYRIELAIGDYAGDFGGSVTWFPVDVFLTVAQAEEVFVELTTDAEYKQIQFTQNDGTSLLYGHMKLFDVSEKLGIFAVSATGWTINANTSIWMYYDKDHADNDTYIGATNTAACEAVYNAEYAAVYPMDDGVDNAHIYDATSNNNDGTKLDANDPIEAAGKVGQGQDFDGTEDYITIPAITLDDFTIEMWVEPDDLDSYRIMITNNVPNDPYLMIRFNATGTNIYCVVVDDEHDYFLYDFAHGCSVDTFYYITLIVNGTTGKIYINTVEKGTDTTVGFGSCSFLTNFYIGEDNRGGGDSAPFDGVMDEIRISTTARSVAWMKGTYNSTKDTLLTYGSEETEAVEVNAIFFGANF